MDGNRAKTVSKLRNFAFACFVLFLKINLVNSNNLTSISVKAQSGANIDLNGPNYTDIGNGNHGHNYSEYDPKGMGGFYNMTINFMNLLVPQQIFPEGSVEVVNGEVIVNELKPLLSHYASLLAFVIILLVIGICMPLCGLCFWCCRCCGNCGANPKPLDKNGDLSKKIGLASALVVLGTLLLFGVISAFVSNEQLQEGTVQLPNNVTITVRDIDVYIQSTSDQINILLKDNYKELEGVLVTNLDDCSAILADQLEEISNATALTEVVKIVGSLDDIRSNLTFLQGVTEEMPKKANELKDVLQNVKNSLQETLQKCSQKECADMLTQHVNQLGTVTDFDSLPKITEQIKELDKILKSGITNNVLEGQRELEKIQKEIKGQIGTQIENVKKSVDEAGKQIVAGGSNITSVLRDLGQTLENSVEKPLEEFGGYLDEYSVYRYYPELAVCLILLIVVLCIVLGLMFGVFCKHPDANGGNCCDKSMGSCFLMIGVGMMFFIAIILVVAIIIHVSVGIAGQRVICDTLREPNNSQIAKLIDDILKGTDSAGIGIDIEINRVLSSCHQNLSFYNVFELQNLFDIDEIITYLDKFDITKMLNELIKQIQVDTEHITLLSADAEKNLRNLIASGIANIKFIMFIDKFNTTITTVNLDLLAGKLNELNGIVPSGVQDELTKSASKLREYQQTYVLPMITTAQKTKVVAKNLMEGLKFGKESFEMAINSLIDEVKAAEDYLQNKGVTALTKIARNFVLEIEKLIRSYLYRVIDNTKEKVGQCGPLSAGLNSTLIATCDKILLPLNGYWFSLFWCLLFFIPTLICSIILATMYKKSEQFQGLQSYDGHIQRPKFNINAQKTYDYEYYDASRHRITPDKMMMVWTTVWSSIDAAPNL
ncbi:hypothetical protein PPYR_13707 [Photinus pyralis]|uniref:Prominin-like protein n=1 Tax=Photinus pyralis TaxID=7054 RepID=A0A5N4A9U7_PHOPY|nr:prominin-like protein [Photinus pyralis]KAB0794087.1 hypothetical protein PPYR_13707 [Photinus pyralis]